MVIKVISVIAYLVLAPIVGCILAGLDRKMSAKLQRRVGPPVLQPYYDVRKLFEKEKMSPTRYQDFYIIAYLVFLIGAVASYFLETPTGASIVAANLLAFAAFSLAGRRR